MAQMLAVRFLTAVVDGDVISRFTMTDFLYMSVPSILYIL
jgi:hypothetical protein